MGYGTCKQNGEFCHSPCGYGYSWIGVWKSDDMSNGTWTLVRERKWIWLISLFYISPALLTCAHLMLWPILGTRSKRRYVAKMYLLSSVSTTEYSTPTSLTFWPLFIHHISPALWSNSSAVHTLQAVLTCVRAYFSDGWYLQNDAKKKKRHTIYNKATKLYVMWVNLNGVCRALYLGMAVTCVACKCATPWRIPYSLNDTLIENRGVDTASDALFSRWWNVFSVSVGKVYI